MYYRPLSYCLESRSDVGGNRVDEGKVASGEEKRWKPGRVYDSPRDAGPITESASE